MKKKIFLTLVATIILAGGVFVNTVYTNPQPLNIQAAEPNKSAASNIIVTGTASIQSKPDLAILTVGVTTENADSKVAQEENNKTMDKVIAAVKSFEIEEKDIQTSNYSIYPVYDYSTGESIIKGYSVNNSVSVKINKLDIASKILDSTIQAGANQIQGIQFTLKDPDKFYQEALVKAIANGKTKADTIAKSLGVTVEKPVSVIENPSSQSVQPYYNRAMKTGATYDMAASTQIIAGETEVSATVQLVYEY